ncbi:MAG: hypothetical protein AB8G18_09710 [Gammaproteobacteria bacterium]
MLTPFKPSNWLMASVACVAAGVLVYAIGRPYAPQLIHTLLSRFDVTAQILPSSALPLTYQLPSFFHMLAMLLATVAVTRHQPKFQKPALIITFILGITMEFVQHPAVKKSLEACADTHACSVFSDFTAYALAGTFDRLDVLAIVLAAGITSLLLWRSQTA